MNRKRLRTAALTLATSLAIGAFGASAASAGTFKAGGYPATISGEQTTQVVFTGVVGAWKCNKLAMQGELTEASSSLDLAPEYGECSWAGVAATIVMNGCTYEYHAGETVEKNENKVATTMDVKCPAGKEMVLTLTGGTCTIRIAEQEGLSSVTAENNLAAEPKDLSLKLGLTGIVYKVENGLIPCPNNPANGTYSNGTLSGTMTLNGSVSGKPTEFWVS